MFFKRGKTLYEGHLFGRDVTIVKDDGFRSR